MEILPQRGLDVVADLEAKFDRIDVPYKTVNDRAITAAIFIPKALTSTTEPKTAPVLVHFHGGALIVGANPEPFFLPDWVRQLAHATTSIFISPTYRLSPETPATEILTDIAAFWSWLPHHLPSTLHSHPRFQHITPDLSHVATIGESAGGYLALQSALLFNPPSSSPTSPNTPLICAVIAQYPALHTDLQDFNPRPATPNPALDGIVTEYLASLSDSPVSIRTSTPWPNLAALTAAALQTGQLRTLYGPDPDGQLTLSYALDKAKERGLPLPPVWIIQGDDDHIVAKAATDELVERMQGAFPDAVVRYTVQEGDHGFDGPSQLGDEWVAEGVEFVKGFWL